MMRLGHMLELIPSTLAGVAIGLTITQTIADTAGPSDFQVIYLPSGKPADRNPHGLWISADCASRPARLSMCRPNRARRLSLIRRAVEVVITLARLRRLPLACADPGTRGLLVAAILALILWRSKWA